MNRHELTQPIPVIRHRRRISRRWHERLAWSLAALITLVAATTISILAAAIHDGAMPGPAGGTSTSTPESAVPARLP